MSQQQNVVYKEYTPPPSPYNPQPSYMTQEVLSWGRRVNVITASPTDVYIVTNCSLKRSGEGRREDWARRAKEKGTGGRGKSA